MALHHATRVHFDIEDGTDAPVVDADGTIHLPVIKEGSTLEFEFTPEYPAAGGPVTVTTHKYRAEWRLGDRGEGGAVAFTGVFTLPTTTKVQCRIESVNMEGLPADPSGHWDCEVEFADAGGSADQVDRVMEGNWVGTKESTTTETLTP